MSLIPPHLLFFNGASTGIVRPRGLGYLPGQPKLPETFDPIVFTGETGPLVKQEQVEHEPLTRYIPPPTRRFPSAGERVGIGDGVGRVAVPRPSRFDGGASLSPKPSGWAESGYRYTHNRDRAHRNWTHDLRFSFTTQTDLSLRFAIRDVLPSPQDSAMERRRYSVKEWPEGLAHVGDILIVPRSTCERHIYKGCLSSQVVLIKFQGDDRKRFAGLTLTLIIGRVDRNSQFHKDCVGIIVEGDNPETGQPWLNEFDHKLPFLQRKDGATIQPRHVRRKVDLTADNPVMFGEEVQDVIEPERKIGRHEAAAYLELLDDSGQTATVRFLDPVLGHVVTIGPLQLDTRFAEIGLYEQIPLRWTAETRAAIWTNDGKDSDYVKIEIDPERGVALIPGVVAYRIEPGYKSTEEIDPQVPLFQIEVEEVS